MKIDSTKSAIARDASFRFFTFEVLNKTETVSVCPDIIDGVQECDRKRVKDELCGITAPLVASNYSRSEIRLG